MRYIKGFSNFNETTKTWIKSAIQSTYNFNLDSCPWMMEQLSDYWYCCYNETDMNYPIAFAFIPTLTDGGNYNACTYAKDFWSRLTPQMFHIEVQNDISIILVFGFVRPEYRRKYIFTSLCNYIDFELNDILTESQIIRRSYCVTNGSISETVAGNFGYTKYSSNLFYIPVTSNKHIWPDLA